MNTRKTIQKIIVVMIWITISSGLLAILIAAIGKKNRQHCKNYIIRIKGTQDNFFADENDVLKLLKEATGGKIKGESISSFNLRKIEELLKDNEWIRDAELYFDNREILHVNLNEREPIARVFTTTGSSFYLDSSGKRMSLTDKMIARVPVFTGFIETKTSTSKDSILIDDIKRIARFISTDSFWMAQVAQVDINADRLFEMVPTIGNHIVKLGDANNIDKKFHRLFIFYKKVLSITGFDNYSTIDVQYAGQVVCSRKGIGNKELGIRY